MSSLMSPNLKSNVMNTKFTFLIAAGLMLGAVTTTQAQGIHQDRMDIRHDRMEIRHDRQDFRHDRRDLVRDRRDLRFDRRNRCY